VETTDGRSRAEGSARVRALERYSKLVGFWAPRRFVDSAGVDVAGLVADVNEKIQSRGFILQTGQVLTAPIDDSPNVDFSPPEKRHNDDVVVQRPWGAAQRLHFGLDNPYQMADEGERFTWSCIWTESCEPYLAPDELIIGVLHGVREECYFYCFCHRAEIVYTTRNRLICMGCGNLHVVLARPLKLEPSVRLTGDEWFDVFDSDGSRKDEEISLPLIDVFDVEHAAMIWVTNEWQQSMREYTLYTRSTPEEYEKAVRGTERDPMLLSEAGFVPLRQIRPPAFQIKDASLDIDLVKGAEVALHSGVSCFVASTVEPNMLVLAIPHLDRAIELLLKARLELSDPQQSSKRLNTRRVRKRLNEIGVELSPVDDQAISDLRLCANNLKHHTAQFNNRAGRNLCKQAVVFIDRFVSDELGLWLGAAVAVDEWQQLLEIPQLAQTAARVVEARLENYRRDPEAQISTCSECGRDALLRTHPDTGSMCLYCRQMPVY
jgi:hypothetical protein